MDFGEAVFQYSTAKTWNGATSLGGTGEARVDLFFRACRGVDGAKIREYLRKSWEEDALDTMKIVAYVRDCRGGKGERELGRTMMRWLAVHAPSDLAVNLELLVKDLGRFDDIVAVLGTELEKAALQLLAKQLEEDIVAFWEAKPLSLAAKWVPSEGKSIDKTHKVVKKLAAVMNTTPALLRKNCLSPLRQRLDILERKMCSGDWEDIDFNKVPSRAMLVHGKANCAFSRHQRDRFEQWKADLKTGKTKVNASVLFPHEIVREYVYSCSSDAPEALLEAQWKTMLSRGTDLGDLSSTLALCDVSGSMYGPPMLVSITLGILISQLTVEAFKGMVLTFETQPQFVMIEGDTLLEQVRCLQKAPWGGSTDFVAALDLILRTAQKAKLAADKMPKRLIVISDMQFNVASAGNFSTNYEELVARYKKANFDIPHLVFWNVNGATDDFQAESSQKSVSLVSGFSVDILKAVLKGDYPTPFSTMKAAISDVRYDRVKLAPNI